jgi:hypothetical protein
MGFFGSIFKGVIRGAKGLAKKAARGIKGAAEKVAKGVKGAYTKVKGLFSKQKTKPWKEGDPATFVDMPGQGQMLYKGGRPVTGKIIKKPGMRSKYDDRQTFGYIEKNLLDPESLAL